MNTKLKNECYDQIKTIGNADPTSRCLPAHQQGCEEWVEHGTLDGVPVVTYYIFDADDIAKAEARCEDNPAECYPWDVDHVDRIEVDIYDCDRHDVRISDIESVLTKWGLSPAAEIGRNGGRKGGKAKTEAKSMASRANGAKGGRPPTGRQYRVEGVCTTRWYATREAAWRAYQTASERRGYDSAWHCPGEVNGDSWDGCQGYGQPGAVHGVRDGHATITLRIR